MPKHFRSLQEFTKIELLGFINRAIELKKEKQAGKIHQRAPSRQVQRLERRRQGIEQRFEPIALAVAERARQRCSGRWRGGPSGRAGLVGGHASIVGVS